MANGQDLWPLMDTQHYCCWTWPDLLIVDKLLWMSDNCCLSKQRRVCEYTVHATFRPWFRTVAPYTEQRVQTKRCNIKMDFLFSATIWKVSKKWQLTFSYIFVIGKWGWCNTWVSPTTILFQNLTWRNILHFPQNTFLFWQKEPNLSNLKCCLNLSSCTRKFTK